METHTYKEGFTHGFISATVLFFAIPPPFVVWVVKCFG